jgi:hypothetical protein
LIAVRHAGFDREDVEAVLFGKEADDPVLEQEELAASVSSLAQCDDTGALDEVVKKEQVVVSSCRVVAVEWDYPCVEPVKLRFRQMQGLGAGDCHCGDQHLGEEKRQGASNRSGLSSSGSRSSRNESGSSKIGPSGPPGRNCRGGEGKLGGIGGVSLKYSPSRAASTVKMWYSTSSGTSTVARYSRPRLARPDPPRDRAESYGGPAQ